MYPKMRQIGPRKLKIDRLTAAAGGIRKLPSRAARSSDFRSEPTPK